MASGKKIKMDDEKSITQPMDDSDSDVDEPGKANSGSDDEKTEEEFSPEEFSGEEAGQDRQEADGQRMTAFNMKEELEEGHFDAAGSFIWDKNKKEVRDNWADDLANMKVLPRRAIAENSLAQAAGLDKPGLAEKYKAMLRHMRHQETVNQAIRRLAGSQGGLSTLERLKLKKAGKLESKPDLDVLTELANEILLRAGNTDVYEMTYHQIKKLVEPEPKPPAKEAVLDMFADILEEELQGMPAEETAGVKRKSPSPAADEPTEAAPKQDEKPEEPNAKKLKTGPATPPPVLLISDEESSSPQIISDEESAQLISDDSPQLISDEEAAAPAPAQAQAQPEEDASAKQQVNWEKVAPAPETSEAEAKAPELRTEDGKKIQKIKLIRRWLEPGKCVVRFKDSKEDGKEYGSGDEGDQPDSNQDNGEDGGEQEQEQEQEREGGEENSADGQQEAPSSTDGQEAPSSTNEETVQADE